MLYIDRSSQDMIYYDFLTSYFVRGGMTTAMESHSAQRALETPLQ